MSIANDSMPGTAPSHVPAALVVDWDFNAPPGGEHDVHLAWKRLQDEANGDIVWSTRNGGHWIFLRAENIHKAYADFAHFSSKMLFIHEPKNTRGISSPRVKRFMPLTGASSSYRPIVS